MLRKIITALTWLLVGLSSTFWGLQLFAQPAHPYTGAMVASESGGVPVRDQDLARLFGSAGQASGALPANNDQLRVVGIISSRGANQWRLALIGDSKLPAQAYRVGSRLPDGRLLSRIERNRAFVASPDGSEQVLVLQQTPALDIRAAPGSR